MKAVKNTVCAYPITPVTQGPRHHFFGFYDLCPWSEDGRYLLAHAVDFIDRPPTAADAVTVGLVDLQDNYRFIPVGETTAWNFQQGARLQWRPQSKTDFIYNARAGDDLISVMHDINGGRRELPRPIYALHPNGRSALTFNYARLQRLRAYGYAGLTDPFAHDPAPTEDGIFALDLETGESRLILSIAEVAAFDGRVAVDGSHHYVTHLLFNPSGSRFCFLHRYSLADGGGYTRLFTANPDGSDLYCLAEESLSHFDWFSDDQILIWGRRRSLLAQARRRNLFASPLFKPLLGLARSFKRGFVRQRILGDQYLLFKDKTKQVDSVAVGIITEDGHPTRFGASEWLLTDTYPDEQHYHTLILYHLLTQKRVDVGRFYALPDPSHINQESSESWDASAMRSDLHPRWNRRQSQICIDSACQGTRQILVVDVSQLITKKQ